MTLGLASDIAVAYEPTLLLENVADFWSGAALTRNGELWGWGWTAWKNPISGEVEPTTPVLLMTDVTDAYVLGSSSYICAIKSDNSLWVVGGAGHDSSRGNGKTYSEEGYTTEPVKVLDNVTAVSASEQILAIDTDGTLWGWGNNEYGQVGNGEHGDGDPDTGDCIVTEPVVIMENVAEVRTSLYTSFALTQDGQLWGWGQNLTKALGKGGITVNDNELQPLPVLLAENVRQFHCEIIPTTVYVVTNDDKLYGWGSGILGDGTAMPLGAYIPYSATASALIKDYVKTVGYVSEPSLVMENVACYLGTCYLMTTDGRYYHWGLEEKVVETYGEANVIIFDKEGSPKVWSSIIDAGYSVEPGAPDEVITGGTGYFYELIATPEEIVFD